MSRSLAIAAVGGWHVHAKDYARDAQQHRDTTLVSFWDDDADRGMALAHDFGVAFAPDLDALLARDDLDGITVTTSTSAHTEVISKAIAAGKHVFTEKHLAPTVAEVDTLIAAAERAQVALVVSLPRLTHGYTRTIDRILDEGALGTIGYSRVRLAHDGWVRQWLPERFDSPTEAIGGALFDLGAHPVYLTRHFQRADPSAVTAKFGHVLGQCLDETAVAVAHFPGGAVGAIEAGISDGVGEFVIELRGTRGLLRYSDIGRVLQVCTDRDTGWSHVSVEPDGPTPFDQWVEHIHHHTHATANLAAARSLTAITTAAYASCPTGVSE